MPEELPSESIVSGSTSDKLHLYLIGHEPDAKYLKRLLDQVKHHVDTITYVTTCKGKGDLDALHGVDAVISEYIPSSRTEFDFSVARNKALEAAPKDGWLLWLDCDDLFPDIAELKKLISENLNADAYAIPYDVGESCDNVLKIRVHRANEWTWRGKVHEELKWNHSMSSKANVTALRDIKVIHAPDKGKSNHLFHIKLLKEQSKDAVSNWAYIAKEYYNLTQYAQAVPWFDKVIAIDPNDIETYHALILRGLCHARTDNRELAKKDWERALHIFPHRREAYYYLSEIYGSEGNPDANKKGLAYINACNAQPDRKEPFQHRLVYQRNGFMLHAQFLKNFGEVNKAMRILSMVSPEYQDGEYIKMMQNLEKISKEQAIEQRDACCA